MVLPACVVAEGSCLHWLFPTSHGLRESSDFSSDPVQLPVLSSVLLPTRSTNPWRSPFTASQEHVPFVRRSTSSSSLYLYRLVLWRCSPKQWVCKGVSVTISQLTLIHCLTFPPLPSHAPCSSIIYSTTPLLLFCNIFPGGFNTLPYFIYAYSSIFCIKALQQKPQWFMWF